MTTPLVMVGDRFRHHKGRIYEVVGFAHHSEMDGDRSLLVLYRNPLTDTLLHPWARPYGMFVDEVAPGVPRFAKLPDDAPLDQGSSQE